MRSWVRFGLLALLCVVCGWSLAGVSSWAGGAQTQRGDAFRRGNFEIRLLSQPNGLYDNIRFDTTRGDAWIQIGTKWEKIPETGRVPIGDYDIHLAPLPNNNHAAIRIDRTSGKTWYRADGKWNEIPEPR